MLIEGSLILTGIASCALLAAWWVVRAERGDPASILEPPRETIDLLFEDRLLSHASELAMTTFEINSDTYDWFELKDHLALRFPDLPDDPETLDIPGQSQSETRCIAMDQMEPSVLLIRRRGQFTNVTLINGADSLEPINPKFNAHKSETAFLRQAMDGIPAPMWQLGPDGAVIWQNAAHEALSKEIRGASMERAPLFNVPEEQDEGSSAQRVSIELPDAHTPSWYQVTGIPAEQGKMFFASNIDPVIKAEAAQRNFVQTLAKTFAHLSSGLAIFDRSGQLALFNPALIDLTDLSADFLSRRPTVMTFFDQLRDSRHMPEPKNYASWRQTMQQMINAATEGSFHETWSLETGQTYSIKGRPHPDGAIAFLFEDISAEVTLTRNFRAELELGQSMIDTLEDSLAVFSASGVLTFCNKAYQDRWGFSPDQVFAEVTITDAIKLWRENCAPAEAWQQIQNSVQPAANKEPWDTVLRLHSGEKLMCHIAPIASGATLVRFSRAPKNIINGQMETVGSITS